MKIKRLLTLLLVAALTGWSLAAQTGGVALAQEKGKPEAERITVDALKAMLEKNEPVTIIDARAPHDYETSDSKIKGAIRITLDEIEARAQALPKDREIVTYCA